MVCPHFYGLSAKCSLFSCVGYVVTLAMAFPVEELCKIMKALGLLVATL